MLYSQCYGNKVNPPLLLLHGFLGNSRDWGNICNSLSSDFYCITVDLPGHGKSSIDDIENSYSIENTAEYLIDYLNKNDVQNCNLLGYSMGGRIAVYLTITYPQYFNKVIIEAGQPGIKDKEERLNRKKLDLKIGKKINSLSIPDFLHFWYNQPIFETLKRHKNFTNLLNSRINNDPKKLTKSIKEMGTGSQPSLWEKLYQIKNDCLLVAGEYDLKYQKIFSKMQKEIYSSKFIIIKGSGHNTHFENSEDFINVVKNFLIK